MPNRNIDNVTIETYDDGYGVFVWSGSNMVDAFFAKKVDIIPIDQCGPGLQAVPPKPKGKIKWKNLLIWRNIK
jgi:hypothetical protein